ncbi:MAG TPA: hypothetical protein VH951_02775 [Dehalococcoidia bacterium]
MRFRRFGWAFALGVVVAMMLAAACSGGGTKSSSTPTQQVKAGLADLNSYKCDLKISGSGGPLADLQTLFPPPSGSPTPAPSSANQDVGFEATISYVKPDKSQMTIKIGNESFSQTTIGRAQWASLGGLTVGPNTISAQSASDLSLCNAFWDEGFAGATASSFLCGGANTKPYKINGRTTLKCTIDKAGFDQIKAALGGVLNDPDAGIRDLTRFTMDIWVTDGSGTGKVPGGLPVRFQADMAGKDASNKDFNMKIGMDVTSMNSSEVSVTAPK